MNTIPTPPRSKPLMTHDNASTGHCRVQPPRDLHTKYVRRVSLTHAGVTYRLKIYPLGRFRRDRRYVAMAKVGKRLFRTAPARNESLAQAEFIRLVDPDVEVRLA